MTTTKVTLPTIGEKLIDAEGRANKTWYDKLKFIETLQPLSDIPAAAATVTSIDATTGAFTLGYGLSRASQSLLAGLTSISAVLGADVNLNNTANFFDGPSVAQGSSGTWFVFASIVLTNTAAAADAYQVKLWDGTTVVASSYFKQNIATISSVHVSLAGVITSPAGNLKVSVRDPATTAGKISASASGIGNDSMIVAVRIA